jgi:hypothetical protein
MTRNVVAQVPASSVWLTLQLPVNLSARWQWFNEGNYRTVGFTAKANQRFYRTGIRYTIAKEWTAAGGVAFFSTRARVDKDDTEFGKEFRIWQELVYQHAFQKKFSMQYRLRSEERFLEATSTKAASHILNINNRLSFQKPVSEKWNIQVAEEFFEQVIDRKLNFNQNRLSTAGIYNVNTNLQLQGTYIWVARKTSSQHVVQFTVRKTILLYESKNSK